MQKKLLKSVRKSSKGGGTCKFTRITNLDLVVGEERAISRGFFA